MSSGLDYQFLNEFYSFKNKSGNRKFRSCTVEFKGYVQLDEGRYFVFIPMIKERRLNLKGLDFFRSYEKDGKFFYHTVLSSYTEEEAQQAYESKALVSLYGTLTMSGRILPDMEEGTDGVYSFVWQVVNIGMQKPTKDDVLTPSRVKTEIAAAAASAEEPKAE